MHELDTYPRVKTRILSKLWSSPVRNKGLTDPADGLWAIEFECNIISGLLIIGLVVTKSTFLPLVRNCRPTIFLMFFLSLKIFIVYQEYYLFLLRLPN